MLKNSIVNKVLVILGASLGIGFLALVIISNWRQSSATVDLELRNARVLSSVFISDIEDYMMKGDSHEVTMRIQQAKEKGFFQDMKIYNEKGKESEAKGETQANPYILKTFENGRNIELRTTENGNRMLLIAAPLPNHERCKQCHDRDAKFLGGLILKTSLQAGYDSARNTSLTLVAVCVIFFFVLLTVIFLFLRSAILTPVIAVSQKVDDLASGEGDLTRQLPVTSGDEIGNLAVGINKLIGKIHDIMLQIARDAELLSTSADQLRNNSTLMRDNMGEAASQTDAVATASEEMAATSCDIAHNCQSAAENSKQADSSALSGAEVVKETMAVMSRISGKVRESAEAIRLLESRSDQIGNIVNTIEDIADQTNLLALNAAIEAARAGEQGRGFAVVADEVRALAERTTRATHEISGMIKSIQAETGKAAATMDEGVREVETGISEATKSEGALQDIIGHISAVASQVAQIATSAEEQTATTNEISSNIHRVTATVQDASRNAEESAEAAGKLAQLASELKHEVGLFRL